MTHYANRIIDVAVLPDYNDDTVANSVWVNYIDEGGAPRKTNAPTLTLDADSKERIIQLLQSAIDCLKD